MENQLHSIVVPVYQSRQTLELLVKQVDKVMDESRIRFELVLVDDGSQDGSFAEIKRIAKIHPSIRGIRLSRNFGHQAALTVGLQESRGEFVAIMDDDLQDPPELLPEFFKLLYDGVDVSYRVRKKRKEKIIKRTLYDAFYRVVNRLSEIEVPLDAGDFCVMKRCVVDAMLELREAHPFLRSARSWAGFHQVGVEYERSARVHGKSGYTFKKYLDFAITGIVSNSYVPLRLATYAGVFAALASLLYAAVVLFKWFLGTFDVPGYASLIILITFLGAVQLIALGITGEYIARLYMEAKKWPVAFVAETTMDSES